MSVSARRSKWLWRAGAVVACFMLIILYKVNPAASSLYPPCPFHQLTGLDCPGCGSTRGLHSLLHGHLLQAADYNILLFPALPLLASGFYYKLTGRGRRLWRAFNYPRGALAIICLFWILRNIPVYPLNWLSAGH